MVSTNMQTALSMSVSGLMTAKMGTRVAATLRQHAALREAA